MYIKKVTCENYGPIARLTIDFPIDTAGRPSSIVLVGQNGAGKSLILSALVEALIEAKRATYSVLPEVPKDQYFRLQKQDYIRVGADYSYFQVEVSSGDATARLRDLVRIGQYDAFRAKYPADPYPHLQISDGGFVESGFYKDAQVPQAVKDAIRKEVAVYFPYFRYEAPAWLNPSGTARLATRQTIYGHSTETIVKTNLIQEIESWILDVILDMELYEKNLIPLQTPQGAVDGPKLFLGHEGSNATTRNLLNQLLTTIFQAKDAHVQRARLGVSRKANRRVSVIVKRGNVESEEALVPTLAHLSSGEVMAFSIGATILREHDQLNSAPAQALSDIRGIALIDEVDLHLHIQLQKDVLPALIRLLPNVQFILTTHSPFFLLGLAQDSDNPHVIHRMPHGERILAEQFVEFQEAYDTFIAREKQFRASYESVSQRLLALERPLIITEGKTDWKHMRAALVRLMAASEYAGLEFDFHEYENLDMGDTTLRSMCEQFSKVPQSRRVIFIFDRDNPAITASMDDAATGYKAWGNNIYSFCIPTPPHRQQTRVSIEFYYTDHELRTPDPATGYRLVFSNEVRRFIESSLTNKSASVATIRLLDTPLANEEVNKVVYDQDCDQIVNAAGNRIAHSKSVFAQRVLDATPPYNNFNVERFRSIFDRIQQILNL